MPKRIQRQRTRGWRQPEGARYVGRPTKFGNPFTVTETRPLARQRQRERAVSNFRDWLLKGPDTYWTGEESRARRHAVLAGLRSLRGKDLVCWCPLDRPCHADVLLKLANR